MSAISVEARGRDSYRVARLVVEASVEVSRAKSESCSLVGMDRALRGVHRDVLGAMLSGKLHECGDEAMADPCVAEPRLDHDRLDVCRGTATSAGYGDALRESHEPGPHNNRIDGHDKAPMGVRVALHPAVEGVDEVAAVRAEGTSDLDTALPAQSSDGRQVLALGQPHRRGRR